MNLERKCRYNTRGAARIICRISQLMTIVSLFESPHLWLYPLWLQPFYSLAAVCCAARHADRYQCHGSFLAFLCLCEDVIPRYVNIARFSWNFCQKVQNFPTSELVEIMAREDPSHEPKTAQAPKKCQQYRPARARLAASSLLDAPLRLIILYIVVYNKYLS